MVQDKRRQYFESGFTLAEVLVVVVILGIAGAMVIPMISDTSDLQASSAARQIVSTLLYAQTAAIAGQDAVQVVFDAGTNSYEVQDVAGNIVSDPVAVGKPYRVDFDAGAQLSGVTLANVNFDGGNQVWFDRLGTPYNGDPIDNTPLTSGAVTVQAGNHSVDVTVEPMSGRIKVND